MEQLLRSVGLRVESIAGMKEAGGIHIHLPSGSRILHSVYDSTLVHCLEM